MSHRLDIVWSDKMGAYWYKLMKEGVGTAAGNWEYVAEGDRRWARRIALHYHIGIPVIKGGESMGYMEIK